MLISLCVDIHPVFHWLQSLAGVCAMGGGALMMSQDVQPVEAPGLHVPRQGEGRLPECRGACDPWHCHFRVSVFPNGQWPSRAES